MTEIQEKAAVISTPDVLEVLYAARGRLENERTQFDFNNWTACTCGHIYAGALGRKAQEWEKVGWKPRGRYAEIIMAVARTLGWTDGTTPRSAVVFVSNYTGKVAGNEAEIRREHALAVINESIAKIECQQEQDRLNVLAQARAVVDSAPVEEAVSA